VVEPRVGSAFARACWYCMTQRADAARQAGQAAFARVKEMLGGRRFREARLSERILQAALAVQVPRRQPLPVRR